MLIRVPHTQKVAGKYGFLLEAEKISGTFGDKVGGLLRKWYPAK